MNTIKMLETTALANDSLQDDTWLEMAKDIGQAFGIGIVIVLIIAAFRLAS